MKHSIESTKLKNGTEILFIKIKNSAKSKISFSINHPINHKETHTAHILEYLIITQQNSKSKDLLRIGANFNGTTYSNKTRYHLIVPNEFLAKTFDDLTTYIFSPKLHEDEFNRQKRVILTEVSQRLQGNSTNYYSTLAEIIPDIRNIKQQIEDINTISFEEVIKFHNLKYHPQNLKVIISGDFSKEEKEKIIETLSELNYSATSKSKIYPPEIKSKHSIKSLISDPTAWLTLIFAIPKSKTANSNLLNILISYLIRPKIGTIYEQARKDGLIYSIPAHFDDTIHPDHIILSFQPKIKSENLKSLTDLFLLEIRKIQSGEINKEVLEIAKDSLYYRIKTADSVEEIESIYRSSFFKGEKVLNIKEVLDQIRNIQPSDIVKFSKNINLPN